MQKRLAKLLLLALLAIAGGAALISISQAQKSGSAFAPQIPRTWDEAALAGLPYEIGAKVRLF